MGDDTEVMVKDQLILDTSLICLFQFDCFVERKTNGLCEVLFYVN